ncbi:MAG: 2OG-Fe(II) oxygenase [Taibaiella sp.]|nr:2OG-Fe(II) oxygenase [Taibaiella sp.]
MIPITHAPHIWSITDFYTPGECAAFIERSETIGYSEAGIVAERGANAGKVVRNNSRLLFTDELLAAQLWEKIKAYVQPHGSRQPVGLNELFRFYKYGPGQSFKKHTDQSFVRNEQEASFYTLLIYLNDDFTGGDTRFDDVVIKPALGSALIFLHSLEHAGSTVKKGVKYVLRTDIMFRLK